MALPVRSIAGSSEGQGLVEYGLILALIGVVAIVLLVFLGGQLAAILSLIGSSIESSS